MIILRFESDPALKNISYQKSEVVLDVNTNIGKLKIGGMEGYHYGNGLAEAALGVIISKRNFAKTLNSQRRKPFDKAVPLDEFHDKGKPLRWITAKRFCLASIGRINILPPELSICPQGKTTVATILLAHHFL